MTMYRNILPVALISGVLFLIYILYITILDRRILEPIQTTRSSSDSSNNLPDQNQSIVNPIAEHVHSCTPREYIFYLKVAKTGSTTMAAILFRWGIQHNLTAVPQLLFRHSKDIIKQCLVPPNETVDTVTRGKYNYFNEHFEYNDAKVKKVMHKDSAYIATLREPLSHERSLKEQRQRGSSNGPDPIRRMLEELPQNKQNTGNTQSWWFGLPSRNKVAKESELLKLVDNRFDLVLITEYMNESLVLLRRKMCWETQDIIHLPLRVRQYRHKHDELPVELKEKHKQYSRFDYQLYGYFKEKLFREISFAGGQFREELDRFKMIINDIYNFCIPILENMFKVLKAGMLNSHPVNASSLFLNMEKSYLEFDPRPFGSAFNITGVDCAFMAIDAEARRLLVFTRQSPWLCRTQHPPRCPEWNSDYCKDFHPRLGMSMAVMAKYSNYRKLGTTIAMP